MGLFSFLKRKKRSANASYPGPGDDFWYKVINAWANENADGIAANYACKLAISESIAMLPAVLMEQKEDGKYPAKDDYVYGLLKDQPNKMMSAFDFFESQQNSLLENGNSYSFLKKNRIGEVREILPLDATRMEVKVIDGSKLAYVYKEESGDKKTYPAKDILHVKYNTKDGIIGRAPVDVCSAVFNFAMALQTHGNKMFEQGGFMAGFLEIPPSFTFVDDEQRSNFLKSFKAYFGSQEYNSIGLLEQGIQFKPYAGNNKDNQFLESHMFSVVNIARTYRMPPVMIGVTESGMSYASIEHLSVMFVQYTMQPWFTRWEQAINWQILGRDSNQFLKFNEKSLLRGDMKAQTEAIVAQISHGLKTINEARALNDDNPSKDPIADKTLVSHNLIQGLENGKADPTNGE